MTDERNARERGEEHEQEHGPEPEGGPFARREAFLHERLAGLEPRRSEEDEDSEPEESSESDEEPPSPGAASPIDLQSAR